MPTIAFTVAYGFTERISQCVSGRVALPVDVAGNAWDISGSDDVILGAPD